jgi:hypothetical protein
MTNTRQYQKLSIVLPFLFLSSPVISFAQPSSECLIFQGSDISNYYCPGIGSEGDETTEYHVHMAIP